MTTRYSDEELEEFRQLINDKLALATRDYKAMMDQLQHANSNDDSDTSHVYSEDDNGVLMQARYELVHFAERQQKFINALRGALDRIDNKTYGIDRMTGELIPKERLRAVPHATLNVSSKNARKDKKK